MSVDNQQSNKRIAKNTIFLYFRMILVMIVTLYTSRVVLAELGVVDYGINNVVAGVVMMFSFLNNSMSSATQRFLTYEIGLGNVKRVQMVFSTSLLIHLAIGLVVIILAETIGLWFVNNKLVIPLDRMFAANAVFQFAVASFFLNIIQVPYNAIIIAHEKMNVYAYISILEVSLKLLIVYVLSLSRYDKLVLYAILLFVVQALIRLIYQIYCRKRFVESRFVFSFEKNLFKEMTFFAGWNLFGSLAWLLREQGLNVLLNLFFGPIINAARGIAAQVSQAVMGFVSNFQVALSPQITKNYAQGRSSEMEMLTYRGLKFSVFLLLVLVLPLCLNIDYILRIWLKSVPEYAADFIVLIMIDSIVGNIFGTPLMMALSASGNIKKYQIVVSSIIVLILPVSYALLKMGCDVRSVFVLMIAISFVSGFVRFLFCKKLLNYSLKFFFQEVFAPVIKVCLLALPIPCIACSYIERNCVSGFLIVFSVSILCCAPVVFFCGLSKEERKFLVETVRRKIKR